MAKDNKIINRINSLTLIEKIIGIERYQIKNIKKNINIEEIKIKLLEKINVIIILFEAIESKSKLLNRITIKINKIKYHDQLQKFVCDCYNSFGNIIKYDAKAKYKTINKKKIKRIKYYNFTE